jgi:hypothetical protein
LIFDLVGENDAASAAVLVGLIVIPVAGGILAYSLALRRRMAMLAVARVLAPGFHGRPEWKLVVRSPGRPIDNCSIQFGSHTLLWEGVNVDVIDIGQAGYGIASLPMEFKPWSIVTVKSGSYKIFSKSFENLEEIRYTS